MRPLDYIDEAAREAIKSPMAKRHGAILVYNKQIIAKGYNKFIPIGSIHQKKSHEDDKRKYSIHAEVACIRSAQTCFSRKVIESSTLIVVRVGRETEELKTSEPCSSCSRLISKLKIKSIYYST